MLNSLLKQLQNDYKEFVFRPGGKKYLFRPPHTIVLGPDEEMSELLLLHELSHAVLQHFSFDTDIKRLKMESDAWAKTKELAKKYGVEVDDDYIEDQLDTYRDWLHAKSKCKKCGLTRFETPDGKWHCPFCEQKI